MLAEAVVAMRLLRSRLLLSPTPRVPCALVADGVALSRLDMLGARALWEWRVTLPDPARTTAAALDGLTRRRRVPPRPRQAAGCHPPSRPTHRPRPRGSCARARCRGCSSCQHCTRLCPPCPAPHTCPRPAPGARACPQATLTLQRDRVPRCAPCLPHGGDTQGI